MSPQTDLKEVVDSEIKEWHFHIYFHQRNADEHHAALELRDAVLRLRRDGAFVAVPLFRVNVDPIGPHPVGSYEIWCPSESFASVFSYLCMNRGNLSILVHPLTTEQRAYVKTISRIVIVCLNQLIHHLLSLTETTKSETHGLDHLSPWTLPLCPSHQQKFPLNIIPSVRIPFTSDGGLPFAHVVYLTTELGYSSTTPGLSLEDRKKIGAHVEHILKGEKEAAKAPSD
ncbi:DOPA-like domain-containing protein [Cristinia sonorae]|uniref:DOPA-like domain-containing protein n=1 Tax=Cristinia sonorae TaxID=1940300 RepID=A0A8K0XQ40_9AGAR|nr:DOPA-like domain-containing protein [Cristinia sonorae]